MVKVLVKEFLPKEQVKIDTFKTLHKMKFDELQRVEKYHFNMDTIRKYENTSTIIGEDLKQLLHVTKYFGVFTQNNKFKSFIFLSQFNESHYSASFELVTIQNDSNYFKKIVLAQEYGNELGDYSISTSIIDSLNFIRTIKHNIRYIHGLGEIDSSYVAKEFYRILNKGEFILTNTTIDN